MDERESCEKNPAFWDLRFWRKGVEYVCLGLTNPSVAIRYLSALLNMALNICFPITYN